MPCDGSPNVDQSNWGTEACRAHVRRRLEAAGYIEQVPQFSTARGKLRITAVGLRVLASFCGKDIMEARRCLKLTDAQRRALTFIADVEPRGATEAMLEHHHIKLQLVIDLIKAGLAIPRMENVRANGRTFEVARVVLTEAGRRTLAH
jgi:hypothetical protein